MTKNEFLVDIKKLRDMDATLDTHVDNLTELLGSDIDTPFFNNIYSLLEFTIELIAQKYKLEREALFWFIYDNEWGDNSLVCSLKEGKKDYAIDSAESFWNFEKMKEE